MNTRYWTIFKLVVVVLLIQIASVFPVLAQEPSSSGQGEDVQERGLQRGIVPAPPYSCGSGVCLCVGQDNCNQMTQPQPCKREKFCVGQTASPPPPLPPQEPAISAKQAPSSTARTTSGNFLICSCRAGQ